MKTNLFIALIMISTITFAQAKKQQIIKTDSISKSFYMKIDGVKGETNDKNKSARYVKIEGIEGESNDDNKSARYVKIEGIEGESNDDNKSTNYLQIDGVKGETNEASTKRTIKIGGAEKPYARSKGDVKLEDIEASKKNNTAKKRVVVLKSNKQSNPNKK